MCADLVAAKTYFGIVSFTFAATGVKPFPQFPELYPFCF